MAGYSGTPLVTKLGIKPEARVLFVGAPDGFARTLGALPANVSVATRAGKKAFDVIVAFFVAERDLARRLPELAARMQPDGGLWIAWPKRASKRPSDLDDTVVRGIGLELGLVDNKVCAIDEVWSGLRFVVRLVDRPKKSPRKP